MEKKPITYITSPEAAAWKLKTPAEKKKFFKKLAIKITNEEKGINQPKGQLFTQIGKQIEAKRKALRMRQEDLSDKSGVAKDTINKIERGCANLSLSTLETLAKALNCNIKIDICRKRHANF